MTSVDPAARPWWQPGVVYQVYPRSFQDSNGDGDRRPRAASRPGSTTCEWLGVDAVWLSPIFRRRWPTSATTSPTTATSTRSSARWPTSTALVEARPRARHQGHPRLRAQPHLGPAPLVPRVPRRRAPTRKRDWYLWRDPAPDGGPPNNWLSDFGGPAWELDEPTGQYYYHAFLKEQPDLNWRNPEVRPRCTTCCASGSSAASTASASTCIWHLIKDDQFRDNPPNPD